MKKIVFGVMMFSLVGISLNSCKKDSLSDSKKETSFYKGLNIKSDGRMLIFKTIEDYQKIVENPTESIRFDFISKVSKMKHNTYTEKNENLKSNDDSLLGDDYLAQILNEDWIVQIGDYLYRVNKPEEKVYVLPAVNIDQYNDLVNQNKSNPNIRKFSTSDNVIELVEEGASGEKGLKCSEDGAGARQAYGDYKLNLQTQISITVGYNKYGIYFPVKITATNHVGSKDKLYIQIENLWYHVRCGNTVGPYSLPWEYPSSTEYASRTYNSYSGMTPLNGYHIKARARYENWYLPSGGNPYTVTFSDWAVIKINSPY